jgi:hypothetical protein
LVTSFENGTSAKLCEQCTLQEVDAQEAMEIKVLLTQDLFSKCAMSVLTLKNKWVQRCRRKKIPAFCDSKSSERGVGSFPKNQTLRFEPTHASLAALQHYRLYG